MMKVVQCWDDGVINDIRLTELLRRCNTVYLIHIQHPVAVLQEQGTAIVAGFLHIDLHIIDCFMIQIALH